MSHSVVCARSRLAGNSDEESWNSKSLRKLVLDLKFPQSYLLVLQTPFTEKCLFDSFPRPLFAPYLPHAVAWARLGPPDSCALLCCGASVQNPPAETSRVMARHDSEPHGRSACGPWDAGTDRKEHIVSCASHAVHGMQRGRTLREAPARVRIHRCQPRTLSTQGQGPNAETRHVFVGRLKPLPMAALSLLFNCCVVTTTSSLCAVDGHKRS